VKFAMVEGQSRLIRIFLAPNVMVVELSMANKVVWENWIGKDYWLSLYPVDHPLHEKELLNDTPHHTGFLVTAMILKGQKAPEWFDDGFDLRIDIAEGKLSFIRHPNIDTPMNRDQLVPLIFPVEDYAGSVYCEMLIKKYAGPLFPHQWMHFQRSMNVKRNYFIRLACDFFECVDSIVDWFSDSESSQIHNIYRHAIAYHRFPTFLSGVSRFLFTLRIDPWATITEYFTRHFEEPPPIHLAWEPIIKKIYGKLWSK